MTSNITSRTIITTATITPTMLVTATTTITIMITPLIMIRTAITVTKSETGESCHLSGRRQFLAICRQVRRPDPLQYVDNEIRSFDMKFFAPFRVLLPILCASAIPLDAQVISSGKTFNGADRTITWSPWQENGTHEFRFRTGDRYLGRAVWEHYLGFEQFRNSSKAIKLSMIRLGNEDVREEVVLRPGSRYAIFKVTNGTMTAHKGLWNWTAQEVR